MTKILDRRYYPITRLREDVENGGPSGTPIERSLERAALEQGNIGASDLVRLIAGIKADIDIQVLLQTIGLSFVPRLITINPATTNNPTQIIVPNQAKRGYIIINPAEISGFSQEATFFPSLLRAPATYNSNVFNVTGIWSTRIFLDVTVQGAGATLIVNAQTQDPLTGNWANSQLDIFGGAAAAGTYYASIGSLGVDKNIRLQATVGIGNETFSISGLFKGGITTPVGSTVYLGGPDVNPLFGYPILPGDKLPIFLLENVGLFAITSTNILSLKIFQLQ